MASFNSDHSKKLCLILFGIMDTEDLRSDKKGRSRELTTQIVDFERINVPLKEPRRAEKKQTPFFVGITDRELSRSALKREFREDSQLIDGIQLIMNFMK